MTEPVPLTLPEQLLLLSLHHDNRVFGRSQSRELTLAYAILYELLLTGRIRFANTRMPVEVVNPEPLGDPVLDECLQMIASGSPRLAGEWMGWMAHSDLRDRIAQGLCRKEILRSAARRILVVFKCRIYEVLDPGVESRLVGRIREAIFGDDETMDVRLSLAITLADSEGILRMHFRRKDLRACAPRLERIGRSELISGASLTEGRA
jgi:hypothetical protein